MEQISIQHAVENDLEEILKLQKDCYISEAEIYNDYEIPPLKQDIESVRKEFRNGVILKALFAGEIVGSVRGFRENSTCYIGKLIVRRDQQNKGLGTMLMKTIESCYNGCTRFELFTGFKSEKNLWLYNKLGYKEFKRDKLNDRLTLIYLEKISLPINAKKEAR